jgi:hypothetical protein
VIDSATVQGWLAALAPYVAIIIPTLIGLGNRAKLAAVDATTARTEQAANGHLAAMTVMAAGADPVLAVAAAKGLIETAEVKAEGLVETARKAAKVTSDGTAP